MKIVATKVLEAQVFQPFYKLKLKFYRCNKFRIAPEGNKLSILKIEANYFTLDITI